MRPAAIALLLAAACGSARDCNVQLRGACVDYSAVPSMAADPEATNDRLEVLFDRALGWWGLPHLAGWTVRFETGGQVQCGSAQATCCARLGSREIVVGATPACFEGSCFTHEVGHVALDGDSRHSSPAWQEHYAMHGAVLDPLPHATCSAYWR